MTGTTSKHKYANVGRHATSCSECHRRKVKCNQGSPCQHCIKRGTTELCQAISPISTIPSTAKKWSRSVDKVKWQDVLSTLRDRQHRYTLMMLLDSFKTRWNWTYEIVEDDHLEDVTKLALSPTLLLVILMTGALVSDPVTINAAFAGIFEDHDDTENKDSIVISYYRDVLLIVEEAFVQSFRSAFHDEEYSVALCQAMFIYCVHCKTLSEDASKVLNIGKGKGLYYDMAEMIKRADLMSDTHEERNSQVRSRLFWNIAAQDINYALATMTKPAISHTDIQNTALPRFCKNQGASREWRYVLVWFRARICRDVLDVVHHSNNESDPAQEAIRRLQVTEMLLPEQFRVLREVNDQILLDEAKDIYIVRTRALITMLYHKAIEAVTRLAMIGFITSSDIVLMRQICAASAQETIKWLLKGRVLAKNRGDLYCVWQLAPAPSCFLSLVFAIIEEKTSDVSYITPDGIIWTWLKSLQESLDFLDIICDSEKSKQLLQSYLSLFQKTQRLVCLERPQSRISNGINVSLTPAQAMDRINLAGCHRTIDSLLSAQSVESFDLDRSAKWDEMEQWLALFLGEST